MMMNHSGAGHLKGMALLVAGVFVALLLLGRPPEQACSTPLFWPVR